MKYDFKEEAIREVLQGTFQGAMHGQLQEGFQNYLKESFKMPFSSRAARKLLKKYFGSISCATSLQHPFIKNQLIWGEGSGNYTWKAQIRKWMK